MYDDFNKKLGKQIKKIREERGLKQSDLAEKIELSTKYVQFIETAHRVPSLSTTYRIAKALGVRVSELFTF